jgi:hypothetical protein
MRGRIYISAFMEDAPTDGNVTTAQSIQIHTDRVQTHILTEYRRSYWQSDSNSILLVATMTFETNNAPHQIASK